MNTPPVRPSTFLQLNPLVPAVIALILGLTLSIQLPIPVELPLALAVACLVFWAVAEAILSGGFKQIICNVSIFAALMGCGAALWPLNQLHGSHTHIARFVQRGDSLPISARVEVLVAPEDPTARHGNAYWIGSVQAVKTNLGWMKSSGEVRIKSAAGTPLRAGQVYDVHGYARRPDGPRNPGAFDLRAYLAASRIFVEISAKKATSLVLVSDIEQSSESAIASARAFVRAKLLEHTVRLDATSSRAMVALLLGYRDPAIADVSESFTNAGVAHLLAISGSHVVFLAGLLWAVMRPLPIRPHHKMIAAAVIVAVYILLTPCGPPVVRAGVAMGMLVIGRLLSRRASLLNMLAAALAVVLIAKPTDLLDAGCQLSFISTAGLILLGQRFLNLLTSHPWIQREEDILAIAPTRFWQWRLRGIKIILGLLVANTIGTLTATPLVLFHFNQINPLAIFTGILALPTVSMAMVASVLQLLASLLSSTLASLLAPLTTGVASFMVWSVGLLAALPAASVTVRSPPLWIVLVMFLPLIAWAMRSVLGVSRATLTLGMLASFALTLGWYSLTQPRDTVVVDVLSVRAGSSVAIQLPDGASFVVNCGSREVPSIFRSITRPALRTRGISRLSGVIISSLDPPHASNAALLVESYSPQAVFLSQPEAAHPFYTLAGTQVFDAAGERKAALAPLSQGSALTHADARIETLWPPAGSPSASLILRLSYAGRSILLMDPRNSQGWKTLHSRGQLQADALVLLGPAPARVLDELKSLTPVPVLAADGSTAQTVTLSRNGTFHIAPTLPVSP